MMIPTGISQEELDKRLQLHYVIDRKKKDVIISNIPEMNTIYKEFVKKIYRKSNEEILSDIKEMVAKLTPELMIDETGPEYYPAELYSDDRMERISAQFKWLRESGNDFEEIEQILQIRRLFKRVGVDINVAQASYIWESVSDVVCAQWLCKKDDETTWWMILTDWVYHNRLN